MASTHGSPRIQAARRRESASRRSRRGLADPYETMAVAVALVVRDTLAERLAGCRG